MSQPQLAADLAQRWVDKYAGEDTRKLVTKAFSRLNHDSACLICQEPAQGSAKRYFKCKFCPRTYHHDCVNNVQLHYPNNDPYLVSDEVGRFMSRRKACPLCCKRTWNESAPLYYGFVGYGEQPKRMQILQQHFEDPNDKLKIWITLKDDGSQASDRALLQVISRADPMNLFSSTRAADLTRSELTSPSPRTGEDDVTSLHLMEEVTALRLRVEELEDEVFALDKRDEETALLHEWARRLIAAPDLDLATMQMTLNMAARSVNRNPNNVVRGKNPASRLDRRSRYGPNISSGHGSVSELDT